MILAAGLLVLLGLGLFVGGLLTGITALYWACVAVCVVAAVLLVLARRQMTATPAVAASSRPEPATSPATTGTAAPDVTAGTPSSATSTPAPAEPPAAEPAGGATAVSGSPAHAAPVRAPAAGAPAGAGPVGDAAPLRELDDPPVEEVEVTDLLLVVDLNDEVLVVDERPRYHLAGCIHLAGRTPIPLPLDEAKTDGFTPCAVCEPDRNLAQRVRSQRSSGN